MEILRDSSFQGLINANCPLIAAEPYKNRFYRVNGAVIKPLSIKQTT